MQTKQERASARATEVITQLAAVDGMPPPPVRVPRGRAGTITGYWADGQLGITIAARRVRTASDAGLRGLLAHEYMHWALKHPHRWNHRRDLPTVAVLVTAGLLSLLGSFGVFVELLSVGVSHQTAEFFSSLLALLLAVAILPGGSMLREYGELRSGKDRVCQELTADLAAAQLVGKSAVATMLREAAPRAPGLRGRLADRCECLLARFIRTHPTRQVRLAALDTFDLGNDAATAAHRMLHADKPLPWHG